MNKQLIQLDSNGYYVGAADAQESPREPGVLVLPKGALYAVLPTVRNGQSVFDMWYNPKTKDWEHKTKTTMTKEVPAAKTVKPSKTTATAAKTPTTPKPSPAKGAQGIPSGYEVVWSDDEGKFVLVETQAPKEEGYTQEEIEAKSVEVRAQRDKLLAQSDIKVVADRWATMSRAQQKQWTEYRQALRDITKLSGFPFGDQSDALIAEIEAVLAVAAPHKQEQP